MRTRSRSKETSRELVNSHTTYQWPFGPFVPLGPPSPTTSPPLFSTEEITDETHKGPPWKSGGPLLLIRTSKERKIFSYPETFYKPWASTFGDLAADEYTPYSLPEQPYYNESALIALGTEGWRRYGPLRPNMDLNQTLAELRNCATEFPAMGRTLKQFFRDFNRARQDLFFVTNRKGNFKRTAKDLANLDLALQFGVLPIISDLQRLSRSYDFTKKRIKYMKAKNGKPIRVGGPLRDYSEVNSSSSTNWGGVLPITTSLIYEIGPWVREYRRETTRKVWFKGRCSFHLPIRDTPLWRGQMYLRQGLGLNPSLLGILRTIYQVTPWTWLGDWFHSYGDVLANYVQQREYGIVYDYAYVMDHETYRTTQTMPNMKIYGRPGFSLETSVTREFKQRLAASPFGFGLKMPDDLSDWQKSILLALGVAKGW